MEENKQQEVKVKLTEYGIEVLKKRHDDVMAKYPNLNFGSFKSPKVDEEGYSKFTLDQIRVIFQGAVRDDGVVPFDDIIFEEKVDSKNNVLIKK